MDTTARAFAGLVAVLGDLEGRCAYPPLRDAFALTRRHAMDAQFAWATGMERYNGVIIDAIDSDRAALCHQFADTFTRQHDYDIIDWRNDYMNAFSTLYDELMVPQR